MSFLTPGKRGSEAAGFHGADSCLRQRSGGNNQYSVDESVFLISTSHSCGHLSLHVPRVRPWPLRSCETTCTIWAEITPYSWTQFCHRGGAGRRR